MSDPGYRYHQPPPVPVDPRAIQYDPYAESKEKAYARQRMAPPPPPPPYAYGAPPQMMREEYMSVPHGYRSAPMYREAPPPGQYLPSPGYVRHSPYPPPHGGSSVRMSAPVDPGYSHAHPYMHHPSAYGRPTAEPSHAHHHPPPPPPMPASSSRGPRGQVRTMADTYLDYYMSSRRSSSSSAGAQAKTVYGPESQIQFIKYEAPPPPRARPSPPTPRPGVTANTYPLPPPPPPTHNHLCSCGIDHGEHSPHPYTRNSGQPSHSESSRYNNHSSHPPQQGGSSQYTYIEAPPPAGIITSSSSSPKQAQVHVVEQTAHRADTSSPAPYGHPPISRSPPRSPQHERRSTGSSSVHETSGMQQRMRSPRLRPIDLSIREDGRDDVFVNNNVHAQSSREASPRTDLNLGKEKGKLMFLLNSEKRTLGSGGREQDVLMDEDHQDERPSSRRSLPSSSLGVNESGALRPHDRPDSRNSRMSLESEEIDELARERDSAVVEENYKRERLRSRWKNEERESERRSRGELDISPLSRQSKARGSSIPRSRSESLHSTTKEGTEKYKSDSTPMPSTSSSSLKRKLGDRESSSIPSPSTTTLSNEKKKNHERDITPNRKAIKESDSEEEVDRERKFRAKKRKVDENQFNNQGDTDKVDFRESNEVDVNKVNDVGANVDFGIDGDEGEEEEGDSEYRPGTSVEETNSSSSSSSLEDPSAPDAIAAAPKLREEKKRVI